MSRELPIIFNTEMVKAILEGRKTQTRRPVKHEEHNDYGIRKSSSLKHVGEYYYNLKNGGHTRYLKAPYQIGDKLYVRETLVWEQEEGWIYKSSGASVQKFMESKYRLMPNVFYGDKETIPSIHMPKCSAVTWLEVTNVKVERIDDISDKDALLEGIRKITKDGKLFKYCVFDKGDHSSKLWSAMQTYPKFAFLDLWQSIYKNRKENPWVWVFDFKVIKEESEVIN